jgi:hypothetical protein
MVTSGSVTAAVLQRNAIAPIVNGRVIPDRLYHFVIAV